MKDNITDTQAAATNYGYGKLGNGDPQEWVDTVCVETGWKNISEINEFPSFITDKGILVAWYNGQFRAKYI